MLWLLAACVWTRRNRLQPHHAHQPLRALAIDPPALPAQRCRHLPGAVPRRVQILPVDRLHQRDLLGGRRHRLVVVRAPRQTQKPALPRDRKPRMMGFDQPSPVTTPGWQIFFQPCQLHVQAPDLLIGTRQFRFLILVPLPSRTGLKELAGVVAQLRLPLSNLRRVDPILASQLLAGLHAHECVQSHLGLELRAVPLALRCHRPTTSACWLHRNADGLLHDLSSFRGPLHGDSDSTGAICGNLRGAERGRRGIPDHWWDAENLELWRTLLITAVELRRLTGLDDNAWQEIAELFPLE